MMVLAVLVWLGEETGYGVAALINGRAEHPLMGVNFYNIVKQ